MRIKRKKEKSENKNGGNEHKLIFHIAINICLIAIVFVTIVACGFLTNSATITAFKSYNGVIYAGNENSNKVALMINVYWGTEYLSEMLDILDEYDAKCTFFVGKTWVKTYPAMCRLIYERGHEIGNHGSNHKEHARLSYEENVKEIQECQDAVYEVTGVTMNLFAPPGGSYSQTTVKAASDLSYKTILWTHDTIDWRDRDEDLIFERATSEMTGGDLILMHPTEATKNALKRILEYINSKNLVPDTVSNTIKD